MTTLAAAVLAAAAGMSAPAAEGSTLAAHSAAGSTAEPGNIGVRLVDIPVDLVDNPRAREYIIDALNPGVTVHRRIEVTNDTGSEVQVTLYPDTASIAHGAFVGAPGATVSDLTRWTTLSQPSIDLPAHTFALDTVTIAVPNDAAPGEQYAVVWVQANGGEGSGVRLVNRVGIRVYLWVGGNNPPASNFTVDTMTASRGLNGRAVVQALVHNSGGRALDMAGTVRLSKVNGSVTAGPYNVQLGTTLAPGQSEPVRATVADQIADGPWNATFDLRSGTLEKTYQAQITFPHTIGTAAPVAAHAVTADDHRSLVYALTAAVVLLSALLAAGAVRRGRSRRRAARMQAPESQQSSR